MIAKLLNDRVMGDLPSYFAFKVTLHGTPEAVRNGVATCLKNLASLNLDPEKLAVAELVMAETLNNIVEHAFCGQSSPGLVRLSCAYDGRYLSLNFKDAGSALPEHILPRPKQFEAFNRNYS